MVLSGHRKSIALFITLGALVVTIAITLNISFIILNWRTGVMLILGVLFFGLMIAGITLNTIFLVREIRRNEQHDRFINAVTHELKTPVSSIRLYLETLQTREIDEAKRREFYKIMLDDSQRLTQTIEQVLRAGLAKSQRGGMNRTELDLSDLVRECVELARVRHHLPDDALHFSGLRAAVRGDADELRAAISNLLDNAIKYSNPDDVHVQAEVVHVGEKEAAVRVRDAGVGIEKNELKRVFRRFYRIPGVVTMRVKGTGLGLFIVQSAARTHGGKAFAESEGPGKGSTFTLQLPRAPQ